MSSAILILALFVMAICLTAYSPKCHLNLARAGYVFFWQNFLSSLMQGSAPAMLPQRKIKFVITAYQQISQGNREK